MIINHISYRVAFVFQGLKTNINSGKIIISSYNLRIFFGRNHDTELIEQAIIINCRISFYHIGVLCQIILIWLRTRLMMKRNSRNYIVLVKISSVQWIDLLRFTVITFHLESNLRTVWKLNNLKMELAVHMMFRIV